MNNVIHVWQSVTDFRIFLISQNCISSVNYLVGGRQATVCSNSKQWPFLTSLAVLFVVCICLFCLSARTPLVQSLQQPPNLRYFLYWGGLVSCSMQEQVIQRATLGSTLLKLSYPPFCSLFVSLPCCFRGISCILPIRLISIVNNRCGAPGNPPPLLVDCQGFWLFVMRFNPYAPTGSQAILSKTRSHFFLFCILRVLLPPSQPQLV